MSNNSLTRNQEQQMEGVGERPSTPPRADIFENKDEYLVIADVPGVDQDHLEVHLDEEALTIRARVNGAVDGRVLSAEFRTTDFLRRFVIPEEVDRAKVAAQLDNGVLRLTLPKSEAVRPRRIAVRAG